MDPRLCPYCCRWDRGEEEACAVCRLALRFIQVAESEACGSTGHQWLAKELAKLLQKTCTRFLLSPSSAQEGRSRSPLLRRSAKRGPPRASQEDLDQREPPPSQGEASSGYRGDTPRPRGSSPVGREDRWRPSLRSPRGGQEPQISAARRGVSRDYLSQAYTQRPDTEKHRPRIELSGAPASKSRASRSTGTPREAAQQEAEPGRQAPETPPLPPSRDREKEGKGKGKAKGKSGKKGEDQPKKKKKNKGLKRGPWWQGYLERRATRRSGAVEEKEAAEEIEESISHEENPEVEAVLSERVARWSDATEEAGA